MLEFHTEILAGARAVREEVFIREQGFANEFDATDAVATHVVWRDGSRIVGTCRFFPDTVPGRYRIGRMAVLAAYRGRQIGAALLAAAETGIRKAGGKEAVLAAQVRARGFYLQAGYTETGELHDEEGCPHTTMVKQL